MYLRCAQCSLFRCSITLFVFILLSVLTFSCRAKYIYSQQDILEIGLHSEQAITAEFLRSHDILADIARCPSSPWITIPTGKRRRRRKERRQKRGCRAGALVRLRKRPHKPPLPSIFFCNARSLANKMDELKLLVASIKVVKHCCILLFTETWLHPSIPDTAIELAGHTV